MYPNAMLFGGGFTVVLVVSMVLGTLMALKRGFFPSLVRLAMIIASALISLPLAVIISLSLSGVTENALHSVMGDALNQIAQHSPSTMELLEQLPIALIAPTLFVSLFLLIKWFSLIIFRIVKPLLPSRSDLLFRILGGVTGALASLICALVILIPTWGVIGIAHSTVKIVSQADTSQNEQLTETMVVLEEIDQVALAPSVNNFVADIFTNEGDSPIYRALTKFELHGKTLVLGDEIKVLANTASDAVTLVGTLPENFHIADLSQTQVDALHALVTDIDASELLRNIGAEWVSAIAGAWQKGEPFMGIEEPQTTPILKPVLHSLYSFLATTDETLLADDLDTFVDILNVLVEHKLLSGQDVLVTLSEDACITDLTKTIDAHTRFRTTVTELVVSLTGAWYSDEAYLDAKKPEVAASLNPVMHTVYGFLSTTEEEILTDDITAFADLLDVFVDHNVIGGENAGFDLLALFADDAFIGDLTGVIEDHTRLRSAVADMLASIMKAWKNGDDYMGLAEPQINASLRPMLHALYGYLAETNESRIVEDIRTFSALLKLLNSMNSGDTNLLLNTDFLTGLSDILQDHNRFRSFFAEFLAELTGAWSNGQSHLGMAEPQMGDAFRPMLRALFGFLGTTKEDTITDDLAVCADLLQLVKTQSTTSANLMMDATFLTELSSVLEKHDRFRAFFAEWLGSAANAWANGNSYMDIAEPQMGSSIQPFVRALFGFLSYTDESKIIEDLATFSDLLTLLRSHNTSSNLLMDGEFLKDLSAVLEKHSRFRNSFAGWLSELASAWENNSSYMGISAPQTGASVQPMVKPLYRFLGTTVGNTIVADLNTFSDLLSVFVKYHVMSGTANMNDLLFNELFLADINTVLAENERFRGIFAEWLADLTSTWAKGEAYSGIAAPQSNALLAPVMTTLYEILGTTTADVVVDDINALIDIIGILKTHDVFNTTTTEAQMAAKLTTGTFVSDMTAAITRHERFHPLLDTITGLGLSAISGQLSGKLPESETLTQMTGGVTGTLNGILDLPEEQQKAAVTEEVEKALQENKIDVPEGVSDMIAQTILNKFGDKETVTEQEVTDYLLELYGSVGNLDGFFQ